MSSVSPVNTAIRPSVQAKTAIASSPAFTRSRCRLRFADRGRRSLAQAGEITTGELVTFLLISTRMTMPLFIFGSS